MTDRPKGESSALEDALRRGAQPEREQGRGPAEEGTAMRRQAAAAARRVSAHAAADGLADVSYATADSPFGTLALAATRRGIVRVAFPEEDVDSMLERLARTISPRIVQAPAALDPARRELEEYFSGRRRQFEVALDWTLIGPFGRRVLKATSEIPLRRRPELRGGGKRRGQPARCSRDRQRPRVKPDPDHHPLPPCAAQRRRARRVRRRTRPQALAAPARGSAGAVGPLRGPWTAPTAPRRDPRRASPRAWAPRGCRAGTTRRRGPPHTRRPRR
jgi:hypothetical protein